MQELFVDKFQFFKCLSKSDKPRLHQLKVVTSSHGNGLNQNGLNQVLKAEVLRVSQKVRTVLVRYLLPGIRILVYSCIGCGTSKIYLCLEDNRSSFSRVSLKSEIRDVCP